jgi:polyhydroxyalkanoate synthesis regulator phasin
MIKTEKGETTLVGNLTELETDLTIIIKCFVETVVKKTPFGEEEAWEKVDEAIETAKLNEEDIEKEVLKTLSEIKDCFGELVEALKKGGSDNE